MKTKQQIYDDFCFLGEIETPYEGAKANVILKSADFRVYYALTKLGEFFEVLPFWKKKNRASKSAWQIKQHFI